MKVKSLIAVAVAAFLTGCTTTTGSVNSSTEVELRKEVNASLDKSVEDIRTALNRLQNLQVGKKTPETVKASPIDNTVARNKPVVSAVSAPKVEMPTVKATVAPVVAKEATKSPVSTTVKAVKTEVAEKPKKDIVKKEKKAKSKAPTRAQTRQNVNALEQHINLSWKGEATDLLRSLSRKIGFSYLEKGVKKSIPISVSANNKTVREVFGLIDGQTGKSANIIVSSSDKTIVLQYK